MGTGILQAVSFPLSAFADFLSPYLRTKKFCGRVTDTPDINPAFLAQPSTPATAGLRSSLPLDSSAFGIFTDRGCRSQNFDLPYVVRCHQGTEHAATIAVVCDGHGGLAAAQAVVNGIKTAAATGLLLPSVWSCGSSILGDNLSRVEDGLDRVVCDHQGTTATVAVVFDRSKLCCISWAGDSPAFMVSVAERIVRVRPLTQNHNASHPREAKRLEACGVEISSSGHFHMPGCEETVNISTFLGNFAAKRSTKNALIADPENSFFVLEEEDAALVIVSDGIMEKLQPMELARAVVMNLRGKEMKEGAESAAAQVVRMALDLQSTDNCSAVVVPLRALPAASYLRRSLEAAQP